MFDSLDKLGVELLPSPQPTFKKTCERKLELVASDCIVAAMYD